VYGPYGGAGYGAAYNPNTGTYARGATVYGPGGSASAGRAYNPYTGASAAGARVDTAYGSAGRGAAYNPSTGTAVRGGYRSNENGTVAGVQTNKGTGAVAWDTKNSQGPLPGTPKTVRARWSKANQGTSMPARMAMSINETATATGALIPAAAGKMSINRSAEVTRRPRRRLVPAPARPTGPNRNKTSHKTARAAQPGPMSSHRPRLAPAPANPTAQSRGSSHHATASSAHVRATWSPRPRLVLAAIN